MALTESPFIINTDGSLLTSSVTLDYESLSYYEVIVAATDSGIPAQTVSELLNDLARDSCTAYKHAPYS